MIRILLLLLLWALGNRELLAQKYLVPTSYRGGPEYNDAQLWENIYVEKNLTLKWNWHINEEGKLTENMTLPSYIYTDLGLTYKYKKYLHFTVAYVPIADRLMTGFVSYEHQFYFDYVLKVKYRHFIFYSREMIQTQYNNIYTSATWNVPYNYLRSKVTVKYRLGLRYVPYVATEFYYHINANQYDGVQFDHARYFAGCFYRMDAVNELELYYMIEPYFNIPAANTNFVIGLGFAHNLY